jgi:prepilin-type N-terminal cleavage/methylation domain-containing protein
MSSSPSAVTRGRRGFTLIELMVVVAIVVMAMGIMVPTLLEFFRNQKLKRVRSHFVSAFNIGRLTAIQEGANVRVVFFKEGARIYNTKTKSFRRDEEWNPRSAPGAIPQISFELRFAGKKNADLVEYDAWAKDQPNLDLLPTPANPLAGQCDVKGLVGIEYQRDGSVVFLQGADVSTAKFNKEPPESADIIVRQEGNTEALYIDIRNTGPIRPKFAKAPESDELE